MPSVPTNRKYIFGSLAAATLALDLWSKAAIFEEYGVRNGGSWIISNDFVRFRFFTGLNQGALWGMGQGFAWIFAILSVVAFAGIIYWLFARKAAVSLWLTVALGAVAGGTLGNLYDRLGLHGITLAEGEAPIKAVRDFFHFQFMGTVEQPGLDWAIFNVADICLVTGAIMLILQSLFAPEPASESESADAAASDTVAAPTGTSAS